MPGATSDVWEVLSTARTIRRFTDQTVDDATLARGLQAAMWAPSGANAQAWRFVVLRSAEQRGGVGAGGGGWGGKGGARRLGGEGAGLRDESAGRRRRQPAGP